MEVRMSLALEEAVRKVLDHGQRYDGHFEVPAADFQILAGTYQSTDTPQVAQHPRPATRTPEYEREMRRLFENAELNP
jgi:hypothetical protein